MRDIEQMGRELRDVGVLHRDVKPDNICLQQPFSTTSATSLILIDFGRAIRTDDDMGSDDVVAEAYRAPELIATKSGESKTYGHSIDEWAFGCVLWEVFTGDTSLF